MRKPSKEFSTRLATAKRFWEAEKGLLREVLMFCCPGREHDFDTRLKATTPPETETYISLPEELASDFAADLVTYFTPSEARWLDYEVTIPVPEEAVEAVRKMIQDREDQFFDLVNASNYNDVAPQVMFEACHGTASMWVEKGHFTQGIHVECVPPHELLISPGFRGYLDRFRKSRVATHDLEPTFDGWDVDLSAPKIQNKMKKPGQAFEVCWGFWLDWSDPGNPQWLSEITVDGHRVTDEKMMLGPMAGSCPLLVGRFNPQVGRPWGRGPGRKALPDMRVYDKIDEVVSLRP